MAGLIKRKPAQTDDFDPDAFAAGASADDFDPDAFAAGLPATPETKAEAPERSTSDHLRNMIETVPRSALDMMSFGMTEPIISGINAAGMTVEEALKDPKAANLETLKKNYKADLARRQNLKSDYWGSDVAGGIGGAFVPTGPANLLSKASNEAIETIAKAFGKSEGLLAKTGGKLTKAAAQGGLSTAADQAVRTPVAIASGSLDPKDAPTTNEALLTGSLAAGGLTGAGLLAKGTAKAAAWTGKKGMQITLGPSEEAITAYVKDRDAIKGAKTVEEIKNQIDETINRLAQDVETAKLSQSEAKDVLKTVQADIRSARSEAGLEFNQKAFDLNSRFSAAQKKLKESARDAKEGLKSVVAPTALAGDVASSMGELKDQISKGSGEAFEILEKDPRAYSVRSAAQLLRKLADEINIQSFDGNTKGLMIGPVTPNQTGAASAPITEHARKQQAQLLAFAEDLERTPERIPAKELKKILQQIDQSAAASYDPISGFDSKVAQAYKQVRRHIDQAVKENNPAYRDKMQEVSERMNLFDEALGRFGDERAIIAKLASIGKQTANPDRELLRRLGELTGRDFDMGVTTYANAQSKLKNPKAIREIEEALPETSEVQALEAELKKIKDPAARQRFIEAEIEKRGLKQRLSESEKNFSNAQRQAQNAEAIVEPYGGISQANSQNKILSIRDNPKTRNRENEKALDRLGKESGQDFLQDIENRRMADQFYKHNTNGARNTGGWAIVGGAVAKANDGDAGTGAAFGVIIGQAIDKFGPRWAEKILDQVITIKGNPTVQKIMSLNLPAEIKNELVRNLSREAGRQTLQGPDGKRGLLNNPRLQGPQQ